jgi:uncharacterized protein (DUF924 family)
MNRAEVLDYWFAGVQREPARLPERMRLWFGGDADSEADVLARDRAIGQRFGKHIEARRRGELDAWSGTAAGRLALILLTDQFPRNVYRGTAQAFADDPVARELCRQGIAIGHDLELEPLERMFFYLPLEHSESLADQDRCVALVAGLEALAPTGLEDDFAGFTRYAIRHRDIVARFGRFPHRNRLLGRHDTEEEAAYLAGGSPAFGQR